MGTTTQKLNYLNETKGLIKNSLNNLGAEITNDTTFREYVDKINALAEEYPTQEQITSFQNRKQQPVEIQPIEPQIIEKNAQDLEDNVQNIEELTKETEEIVQNIEKTTEENEEVK